MYTAWVRCALNFVLSFPEFSVRSAEIYTNFTLGLKASVKSDLAAYAAFWVLIHCLKFQARKPDDWGEEVKVCMGNQHRTCEL